MHPKGKRCMTSMHRRREILVAKLITSDSINEFSRVTGIAKSKYAFSNEHKYLEMKPFSVKHFSINDQNFSNSIHERIYGCFIRPLWRLVVLGVSGLSFYQVNP